MLLPRATSLLLLLAPALTQAATAPACSSGKAGDTAFETCGTFCKANHSASHCAPNTHDRTHGAVAPPQNSQHDDASPSQVRFASARPAPTAHLERSAKLSPPQVRSRPSGRLSASGPHGWCAVAVAGKPKVAHVATPKAKAPSQPTCSSGLAGDTSEEGCASFCKADDPNKAANHCRFCKCRKCGSCAALLSASKAAAAAAPFGTPTHVAGVATKAAPASQQLRLPCKSKEAGDFSYRTCAPFCQASKALAGTPNPNPNPNPSPNPNPLTPTLTLNPNPNPNPSPNLLPGEQGGRALPLLQVRGLPLLRGGGDPSGTARPRRGRPGAPPPSAAPGGGGLLLLLLPAATCHRRAELRHAAAAAPRRRTCRRGGSYPDAALHRLPAHAAPPRLARPRPRAVLAARASAKAARADGDRARHHHHRRPALRKG